MHSCVLGDFRKFNEQFEGVVPYMYLDIKGLVTIGVGNLIDPLELALTLPFRFKSDPTKAATKDQIAAEWRRIKGMPALAKQGHRACAPLTQLLLDNSAIDAVIAERLTANEAHLKSQPAFHNFDAWPADAQLALLSMAWAMGPGGPAAFPKFAAACAANDFTAAADDCRIRESDNPGVAPRNAANRILLLNAAKVAAAGLELASLHYPRNLAQG